MHSMRLMAVAAIVALAACSSDKVTSLPAPVVPQATVLTVSGNIAAKVDEFRNLLGPANGGTAGEQTTGRREINWDGAGANPFDNKNDFPAGFFNSNVKAGAVFTTPGTGFRNDSTDFSEVNATYATQFNFFSANKIFAPVGSNQLDQLFQVAGQPTPAVTRGFGIVFSDVDLTDKTTIEAFAQVMCGFDHVRPLHRGVGIEIEHDTIGLLDTLGSCTPYVDFERSGLDQCDQPGRLADGEIGAPGAGLLDLHTLERGMDVIAGVLLEEAIATRTFWTAQ